MPLDAHRALTSQIKGYKKALNLSEEQNISLRDARDCVRNAISSGFGNAAKELEEKNLFQDGTSLLNRSFETPKFRMQGSFSYFTCNQPAHVPPQEIDLDDGLFMPVSYFQLGSERSPVIQSNAYFLIIEKLLTSLCNDRGWELVTDKPSCIRVKISNDMHTDLALYAVPDVNFLKIMKDARNRDLQGLDDLRMEDSVYRDISQDEIMLAHRQEGWKKSDPRKLEDWFNEAVEKYGDQVRAVSRYLKGWKDFQWEKGHLASVALMAAVVSIFDKASAQIPKDRDDLALLRVSQELPSFLAEKIVNPVVEGARLDEGWSEDDRDDYVSKAQKLNDVLSLILQKNNDQSIAVVYLRQMFGDRIPDDLTLYLPDTTLETKNEELAAPAALTVGIVKDIDGDPDNRAAVNKQGDGRYG